MTDQTESLQMLSRGLIELSKSVDALRNVNMVLAYAIGRQKGMDRTTLLEDARLAIDSVYRQEDIVPIQVLDFLVQLETAISDSP